MANDLKLLPRAERLLSGTINASMDATQTTVDVSNPPASTELPTYWEIEPDSSTNKELVRITGVSSNTITLERGLNNGGTGFTHTSLSPYKGKITSLHWNKVADALESGYLFEDTSYTFTRVSTSSFKITASGIDRTGHYTVGRRVRLNATVVVRISSSSYSNPDTTVVVDDTTVPTPITSIELEIATKGNTDIVDKGSVQTITGVKTMTSPVLNTPTLDTPTLTAPKIHDTSSDHHYIVVPSELTADRNVTLPLLTGADEFTFNAHTQTLTNKTLTSPKINENVAVTSTATELNLIDGSVAGTAVASKALVLGANKDIDALTITGTGGTAGGQLGWDQSNLNFKVGDNTANQIIHVSAWTAFTPAWGGITEGNGTNTGAYCVLGKSCLFRATFIFGSTSSASGGGISLTLPVTKSTGYNGTYETKIGSVTFYDSGSGNNEGYISSNGAIYYFTASGSLLIRSSTSTTAPFTWATGDVITIEGAYEVA